eukprot:305610_1
MFIFLLVVLVIVGFIGIIAFQQRDYLFQIMHSMKQKPFKKGDTVFISDLILSPQYNNLIGSIASDLDPTKKRFAVKILYHDKFITVKPENLSFLTNQTHIEALLRNLAINQKSKYTVNTPHDFIHKICTKYRSSSLPPLHQFFNSSLRNYQENADSVYCVIQYLSLFSSIGVRRYFTSSFWTKSVDKYGTANTLKSFSQSNQNRDGDDARDDRLSILFLELLAHKMCIIKYGNAQFRVVQSMSTLCDYSLHEELNQRQWMNAMEMEQFCDALVDVIYAKKLNRSKWLFGDEMDQNYFDDNESWNDALNVCIMDDLNVQMFIKSATKIIKYIAKFDLDPITIACL